MADCSETLSDNFNDNDSSEINTPSVLLSAISTEANVGSISTSYSTPILRLSSSIHKHCRTTMKEEKIRTKKHYFCKYCSPQDPKGHHTSTQGLQHHL
jgi:hypothetical protein